MRCKTTFAVFALLTLISCSRLDPPRQAGELVVAVHSSPAFYQVDGNGETDGFVHDIVLAFAKELGVPARFVVFTDADELLTKLRAGAVHFSAGLALDARRDDVRYSAPLLQARPLLVRHADAMALEDDDKLAATPVETIAGSLASAVLIPAATASARTTTVRSGIDDIELLTEVAERRVALAATDTLHFRIAANYFPDLRIARELPGDLQIAWAFATDSDADLYAKANDFIARARTDGTLAHLEDRYFGYLDRLKPPDAAGFLQRLRSVLPHYRHEFIEAQANTGVDWRLLAALAYQESAWNPQATSPTGVRGIMMLTEETADAMQVDNRLDPRQSILAGARYFADLLDQLPPTVKPDDRPWLALATYNLGRGHMNGARAIAKALKHDPDSWAEMKRVLPLLARPEYYARLKSGPARGGEAVIMVENIRSYYDIIRRFEPPYRLEPDYGRTLTFSRR